MPGTDSEEEILKEPETENPSTESDKASEDVEMTAAQPVRKIHY